MQTITTVSFEIATIFQVHGRSQVVHYAELANRRFSVEALL